MKIRLLLPPLVVAGAMLTTAAGAETSGDAASAEDGLASAIFAGGCFWCMEPPYDELEGVVSTTSGYIGGDTEDPTYEEVSAGGTGHAEAIEVVYDPDQVGYAELLNVYWPNVDPLTANAQFCDHGSQYRSAIFYQNEEQERLARKSKQVLEESRRFDQPIVTEIEAAGEFYPAEDYHQDYYKKNPLRYKFYYYTCGREQRLQEVWGEQPEPVLPVASEDLEASDDGGKTAAR